MEYTFEYKQGRKRNFFLREHEGTFFLEKITKGCGFTVIAGDEQTVTEYIEANGYKLVGIARAI